MEPNRNATSVNPDADSSPATQAPPPEEGRARRPSVGVLIDLALTPTAGGHVRFWSNIAHAAAAHGCAFDLTFHFQSDPDDAKHRGVERVSHLSEHVRIVTLPPAFSTARLPFLAQNPDHTDLAPYHRRLANYLRSYDVLHTTDAYFAYARTATRVQDRRRQALVTSIHTDTPAYTRVYSQRAFENLFGDGWFARRVIEDWQWPAYAEQRMQSALSRHLARCEHVWLTPKDDLADFCATTNVATKSRGVEVLRRGLDAGIFSPDRADRPRLEREFGLDTEDFVLVFAGRIDIGKEILVAAEAVRALIDRGRRLKLILAGEGSDAEKIRELLGPALRLPGFVKQERLGFILASSDAFVFPSRIETAANAVIEARATALPTLVSPHVADILIREDGVDGMSVEPQSPDAWARAIDALLADRDRARKMGALANSVIAATQPGWIDVLANDLVPGWQRVLRAASPAL